MKEEIRRRAIELGFDACRFTTAAPPDHAAEFEKWIGENQHGEMNYLERNAGKRINPQAVLPGARSVITLAASYHATEGSNPQSAIRLGCPVRLLPGLPRRFG